MDTEILTNTLKTFTVAFNQGYGNLLPTIRWLAGIFLGIELTMMGLWWALGGGERLVAVE